MRERETAVRALTTAVHVLAILLILLPLVDLAANIYPLRPDELRWRYGAMGLLSGFLLTPMVGLLLMGVAAAVAEQRWTLRLLGWVAMMGALLLVAGVGLFGLDGLQLSGQVPAGARAVFLVGAVKALVKLTLVTVWLFLLGRGAAQAARGLRRARSDAREAAPELILQSPARAAPDAPAAPLTAGATD